MKLFEKQRLEQNRRFRIRSKVKGTAERPRLTLCLSNKHAYAQCIDDDAGRTLGALSSLSKILRALHLKPNVAGLQELGFDKSQVYTTFELKMKCALGKCGRCNIGDKYVCKDGPVFRLDEMDELPDEY